MTGNTANDSRTGFYIFTMTGGTVSGNTANNSSENGFFVNDFSAGILSGNTANGSTQRGYYVEHFNNGTLSNNTANANTLHGFEIDSFYNGTVTGNTSSGNTENGFLMNSIFGGTFSDNVATDNVAVTGYSFTATGTNTSSDGYYEIDGSGVITITAAGVAADVNDFETAPNSTVHSVTVIDGAGNSSAANITLNDR